MEQVIMTAVFALCAAMSLQAFSSAYNMSKTSEMRERAAAMAEGICASAEAGTGLTPPGQDCEIFVGMDGRPRDRSDATYRLTITWNDTEGLPAESMDITITSPDGITQYAEQTAVWQTGGA